MTGNQNYPARSVKSSIVCRKEKVFQQKPLEKTNFTVKPDQFWQMRSALLVYQVFEGQLSPEGDSSHLTEVAN